MPEGLVDIAEMRTLFVGDISDLTAKSQQAREIVQQTVAAMNASMEQGGAGFSAITQAIESQTAVINEALGRIETQVGQLVTVTGAGFESMTEEVTASMAQASQVTQAALGEITASVVQTTETAAAGFQTVEAAVVQTGQAIQTSIGEAAVAMQGSLETAAVGIQSSLENVQVQAATTGETLTSSFAGGTAGLEALSAASVQTGASIEGMKAQVLLNRVELANLDAQILTIRTSLAELEAQQAATSAEIAKGGTMSAAAYQEFLTAETQVSAQTAELEAQLGTLTAQKAALTVETRQLATALQLEKFAAQQVTVAQAETAAATAGTGAATDALNFQMRRHIGTMEGSVVGMRGMGMNLAFLSEAFGATSAASFVLFGAIAIGTIKLIEMMNEQGKAVTATNELLDSNVRLADTYATLSDGSLAYAGRLGEIVLAYDKIGQVDIIGTLRTYQEEQLKADVATREGAASLDAYTQARAAEADMIRRQSGNEQDLTSERYKEAAATVQQQLGLDGYIGSIKQSAAAHIEAADKANKSIDALVKMTETGRLTEAQVRALSDAGLISAQTFDLYKDAVFRAANAQEQLNAAVRNFKPPNLDSTIKTMGQLRDSINKAATEGATLSELAPRLNALKKATAEQVAEEATKAGVLLKSKDAQAAVTREMTKTQDATTALAAQIINYDRNLKAATSTTEKHAAASHAGHAALIEYKDGVDGLTKAFDRIATSSIPLSSLFDALPKGARQAGTDLKNALGSIATGIDQFFASFGAGVKVTKEQLANFGVDFIGVLRGPTVALAQAREDQTKELIAMNEAFIAHNQDLRAILKDGSIIIVQTGLDAVEKIKESSAAEIRAYDLNEAFAKSNSDLVATIRKGTDNVSQVIITQGQIIAESTQGVFAEIPKSVGEKLSADLQKGVADAMKVTSDTFIEGWKNLKATGTVSATDVITGITDAFNALPERFKATIKPAFDAYVAELTNMASATETQAARIKAALTGDQGFLNAQAQVAAAASIKSSMAVVIDTYKKLGEQAGLTGDALTKFVVDAVNKMPELGEAGRKAAADFQKYMNQISFDALQKKVNAAVNGIVEIFTLIPSKFGDMAKEIQKVVNTVDKILGNLHKIFAAIPENLGGVIALVLQHFKTLSTAVQDSANAVGQSSKDWVGDLEKIDQASGAMGDAAAKGVTSAASATASAAGRILGSLGSIASGFLAFAGARGQGALGGALSGALGGLAALGGIAGLINSSFAPLLFSPWGALAIGGGALIGGLIGLFTGGKSAAQKQQEALQLQELKDRVAQDAQNIVNTAIDGFNKALEFFDKLDDFTAPRKAKFQAFWKAMTRLMDGFLELAKTWAGASLDQAKQFAETISPIVTTIGQAVTGLDALAGYAGVPGLAIARFGSDLARTLSSFIAVAQMFDEDKPLVKQARKFAERVADVVSLIASSVLAFMGTKDTPGLLQYSGVPAQAFDLFAADLKIAVQKMGEIAESIDADMVKQAQKFSDKVQSVTSLIASAMLGFLGGPNGPGLAQYAKIPIEVFDAFFADLVIATNKMAQVTTLIDTTMLAQSQSFAEKTTPIFTAIKSAVEALSTLKDYTRIPAETFQALLDNFSQAINTMLAGITVSERFVGIAKIFEANIIEGAAHLANAVAIFTASIRNLGYGLAAFGVTVTLPSADVGTTAATGSGGGGGFAPSSATGGFAPSSIFSGGPSAPSAPSRMTVINGDMIVDPTRWKNVGEMMAWFADYGENVTDLIEQQFIMPARVAQG